ncbi:MAG: TIM barrel protein [Candidatus Hydrogenedens sp.]|nr:TIM barrel protein [Candidatus Hydrogenedens sp.]
MAPQLTRRSFLATGAALCASAWTAPIARAAGAPAVCVFSKHFQHLDYAQLAATGRQVGLDGIDLTVREGGHVLPENVAENLPKAVEALRAQGLSVPMITTNLKSGKDPDAETILMAASEQGIGHFRIGGHKYSGEGDPIAEAEGFAQDLRSLAELAGQYNMTAGYHNHSGSNNFGAPLWDLLRVLDEIDSPHLGSNFDVGHATVEGPYGDWPITARALAPRVKMLAVKDFEFERGRPRWCTLGEGMVDLSGFFAIFREHGFAGPVSIHFENSEFNRADDASKVEQLAEAVKRVRRELRKAGYE